MRRVVLVLSALFLLLFPTGSSASSSVYPHFTAPGCTPSNRWAICLDGHGIPVQPATPACPQPRPGQATCLAEIAHDASPLAPAVLHTAYQLPCTPLGPVQTTCQTTRFGPETIAIVDAYGDPTIESDLATFDQRFGLPACTQGNGCLAIRNQRGQTAPLPPTNNGWIMEIALDVETAHGLCQTCRILLIETDTSDYDNLAAGVNTAAAQGATVISNSYGGSETTPDAAYNHPGIAIVASTGDSGYEVESPASYPHVIAVGGTTLLTDAAGNYVGETAWTGAGSGCATLSAAEPWQLAPCNGTRGAADISADADPNSGVYVYSGQWLEVGGTSLAAPLVASSIALAGGLPVPEPASVLYANASFDRDITSGSNGNCGTVMCSGGPGYDGPTGIGSPHGLASFGVHPPTPIPPTVPPTIIPPTPVPPTATPIPPTPNPTNTSVPTVAPTVAPTVTPAPTFPAARWNAWTTRHHKVKIPYRDNHGRLTGIAKQWWHWGTRFGNWCGGVTSARQVWPGLLFGHWRGVVYQRFTHGTIYKLTRSYLYNDC